MKNLNFTCPHCGGHKVFGMDKDGLYYDYDNASLSQIEGDDVDLFCDECFAQITEQEIIEQNKE